MSIQRRKTIDTLFRDDRGMTTTAMAVSIMVSLALVFTGAQVHKTTSASAEIQEVADVCVLAAESEVAEFMVCVKVCDASLLSLGLLAGVSFGLGIVCACVPPLESLSASLIDIGNKVLKARSDFAEQASKGLNALQSALPFLAAASASAVASANNKGAMQADYIGCSFLLPQQSEKVSIGSADTLDDAASKISDDVRGIREKASKAEEAAKKAQAAKEEAFKLDCGNYPGYCQYERAGRFSWMEESENPLYSNVDSWSFSVAFERAKSYYAYREGRELEPYGSVDEKASYFVRMKFYSYAYEKLETEGYVHENGASFSANFPKLYRNTSEFRQTSLYNSASFPVSYSSEDEMGIMHAWSGCPAAVEVSAYDRISALDSGVYAGCDTCNFSIESLGNVASASTNISNGFEYHYERIRQQAEKYQEAFSELDPLSAEVKDMVNPLLDSLADAIRDIGSSRIHANPCGSVGAIAVVINRANQSTDTGLSTLFVRNAGTLGTRIAVSGSTLVEDSNDSASDVISSLLDNFPKDGSAVFGGARIVLDCWSDLLKSYEKGQKHFEKTLSDAISTLSLGTLTGLGDWCASAFEDIVSLVGLEPANINALKPTVLNTGHLSSASNDALGINFSKIRAQSLAASSSNGSPFQGLSSWLSGRMSSSIGSEIIVAEMEFPIGDSSIPISIAIPESISSSMGDVVMGAIGNLEDLVFSASGKKVWQ